MAWSAGATDAVNDASKVGWHGPGSSSAHALQSLTPGTWADQASSARITDDGSNPDPAVSGSSPLSTAEWNAVKGTGGVATCITAWGAAAINVATREIYTPGGGHGDYLANGVPLYDFSDDAAETWSAFTWPSHPIASDNSGINPDGTPDSRHTYSAACILDGYLYMSGAAVNINATGAPLVWRLNLSTKAWSYLSASDLSALNNTYATGMVADSANGLIWCWNNDEIFTIDKDDFTSTGVASKIDNSGRGNWNFNSDLNHTMALDASKEKIVVIGYASSTAESIIFDISNISSVTVSAPSWTGTGASAFTAESAPGMTYDSTRQDLFGWIGGTSGYAIDADSETITTISPDASNSVTPPSKHANGCYSRLLYSSVDDGFVLIPDSGSTYYYKRAA